MADAEVRAHRGGPLAEGTPAFAENSLPAFEHAAKEGDRLEFDTQLTSDNVPLVIHDPTLDRTTNCTGPVAKRTAAEIAARCRINVIGADAVTAPADERLKIPTLDEVLALAKQRSASITTELKVFTRPAVTRVASAIQKSGLPADHVLLSSADTGALEIARQAFRGVATDFIVNPANAATAAQVAVQGGFDWVSAPWPVTQKYVKGMHDAGIKLSVFTLNAAGAIKGAGGLGVDALETDDPPLVRRLISGQVASAPKSPSSKPGSSSSGSSASSAILIGVGVLVLLLIGGAIYFVRRRSGAGV